MRTLPVCPVDTPLPRHPLPPCPGNEEAQWHFSSVQVAAFDALLHEIHPDARRISIDQLSQLTAWLLALPEADARRLLDERLLRIEELRAMLDDDDWDCADADRARIGKLLDYLDQAQDLIPDRIPRLGLLDDVLLLELAWPAVVAEAEDYRDFCAYRYSAHPAGDGAAQRAAWVRDRLAELALWRQRLDAASYHYVEGGHPDRPFRIG